MVRYLREWVKEKNVSRQRNAVKSYGNIENKVKNMSEREWKMELHRRRIIRELILICANSGIRAPKEIFLTWGDAKLLVRGNGRYVW